MEASLHPQSLTATKHTNTRPTNKKNDNCRHSIDGVLCHTKRSNNQETHVGNQCTTRLMKIIMNTHENHKKEEEGRRKKKEEERRSKKKEEEGFGTFQCGRVVGAWTSWVSLLSNQRHAWSLSRQTQRHAWSLHCQTQRRA